MCKCLFRLCKNGRSKNPLKARRNLDSSVAQYIGLVKDALRKYEEDVLIYELEEIANQYGVDPVESTKRVKASYGRAFLMRPAFEIPKDAPMIPRDDVAGNIASQLGFSVMPSNFEDLVRLVGSRAQEQAASEFPRIFRDSGK